MSRATSGTASQFADTGGYIPVLDQLVRRQDGQDADVFLRAGVDAIETKRAIKAARFARLE